MSALVLRQISNVESRGSLFIKKYITRSKKFSTCKGLFFVQALHVYRTGEQKGKRVIQVRPDYRFKI